MKNLINKPPLPKTLLLIFVCLGCLTFNGNAQKSDLYSIDKIGELRINLPHSDWRGILDSLKVYEDYLPASVTLNGKSYEQAGVRYRGSSSFRLGEKKNPWGVKLNLGDKEANYDGHTTLKLSNGYRDPSMVREVLAYEIANQYMVAPRANFMRVFVNGQYEGLYINIEPIDKVFLKKHYGKDDGTFVKGSPDLSSSRPEECLKNTYSALEYEANSDCYAYNYELKSSEGWDDLIKLTKTLKDKPSQTGSVLNMDQTLWMLAFNNVFMNLSSYTGLFSHNYYLYKDTNGKFNPIIWDLNMCFGTFRKTGKEKRLSFKEVQRLSPLLHSNNSTKPLISQILNNDTYKMRYFSMMRIMVYDHLHNGKLQKRARDLQKLIDNDVKNDKNNLYDYQKFKISLYNNIKDKREIPALNKMLEERDDFLRKNKYLTFIPPAVTSVDGDAFGFINREGKYYIRAKADNIASKMFLYYRYSGEMKYSRMAMSDDGQSRDKRKGDSIFGIYFGKEGEVSGRTVEFYIRAENAKGSGYSTSDFLVRPHRMTFP